MVNLQVITPAPAVNPASLAYIIFTSGTTGQPKRVTITHANVINYLAWAYEQFPIGADDKVSCHPPLYFDISV